MRALILSAALLFSVQVEAATLYVNNTGSPACSDATNKASNNASNPWCTIGRAAWGNAVRSSPSGAEAADDDDVVLITGSTYDYTASVLDDNAQPLYNPTNDGSSGHPITFQCVGVCVLTAGDLKGPVIGSNSKDYITFIADRTTGSYWYILACGWATGQPDTCASNTVMTKADTGPVFCGNTAIACWIEGFTIVGSTPIPFADNWSGIRWQGAVSPVARNNAISDFQKAASAGGTTHNQTCTTSYGTSNGVYEHNTCTASGSTFYFKDTGSSATQSGNVVRYNLSTGMIKDGYSFSEQFGNVDRNDVYQNIVEGAEYGWQVVSGAENDAIYNNTFYNLSLSCETTGNNANMIGIKFWNNICHTMATRAIVAEDVTMPAASRLDNEHNVYFTFTAAQFYGGSDGNRTFASYLATYTDQDQTDPDSITSDPLLVNPAGNDFRLCTGVNTPATGCSGASPAINLGRAIDGGATVNAGADPATYCIGLEVNCQADDPLPIYRLRVRPGEM